jgi:PAS domain S-box-containing protein
MSDTHLTADEAARMVERIAQLEADNGRLQAEVAARARVEESLRDSEARYHLLVANAAEAIYVVQEHTIRFANPMCARLLGIAQSELVGRTTLDFVPEQDRAWASQHHERLLRGEVTSDWAEFRILPPGSEERWLSVGAVRILWNGQPATLNLASDITAQKRATEALRQREEELSTLIENLPCGVFVKDLAGRFTRVNRLWAEMAGLPLEEIVGKTIYDLVPEMPDHWRAADAQLFATGEPQLVEQHIPRQKSAKIGIEVVETRRVPLRDAHGAIVGLIGATFDITARRKAEQEREALITQLQEALAQVKTLRGLVPICAHCKKIRNDAGYWQQVEVYVRDHSEAEFSHGICPDCMEKLFPEYAKDDES